MSGPSFARPDVCSIGAVASQGRTGGAARGVRSAVGHPLADDDRHLPMASSIDRAIRLSTAAAVLAIAGIAAYVAYAKLSAKMINKVCDLRRRAEDGTASEGFA